MPGSSPEDKEIVESADVVDQQAPNSDGERAESSTAAEPKAEKSMLDAVKSALKPAEASPTSEKPDQQSEDGDPDSKDEPKGEADDELSEEELKGLHEKTQKRFQRLTSKLTAKDTEISGLKPKAEELDKINGFISNAGLSADDVGNLLQLGALLKSDPKAAYERMVPTIRHLQSFLGEMLPADLQKQVDDGYLTEAHARELVAARSRADFADQRSKEQRDRDEQNRQRQEAETLTRSTLTAVEKWESKQAERDPDWSSKRAEVAEQVEIAIRRRADELGKPWFPTSDEAVKLSQDALKLVDKRMSRFQPKKKQAISAVDTSGSSNRSLPKPSNMLDVVKQALGK